MRQLLDAKQKALSDIDQEISALCAVTAREQDIQESKNFTSMIITLKAKIENVRMMNVTTHSHKRSQSKARKSKCCFNEATKSILTKS